MEETLESYKSKLESLSSTMESQQKLIHDTIGQQLTLKKEFADKENNLNLKISELESLLKDKNSEISSLENQLKESKLAFERLNSAILSNSMLPLVNTAGLMMDADVSNAIHQLQAAQQQVAQQQFQQEIQQQVVLQQMQVIESLINTSPPESNNDKTMLTDYESKVEITPPITPQISKTSVLNPSPLSQVVSQNEFEENSQESEFMTALQNLSNSLLEKDYKESNVVKEVQVSQEEWSQEQDLILKKTVGLHGHDWNIVTAFVPEKSAQQCAYRWKTVVGKKVKGRWYKAEDAALLRAFEEYVKEHGPIKKNSITAWSAIADKIPGRSGPACMVRYNESLDPRMKRGKWNSEEDELLRQGFEIHGASWVKIAEMIPGRTQRQCRTRHLILQGNLKRGNLMDEVQKEPNQYLSGMDDSDVENYSESDMASDFGF